MNEIVNDLKIGAVVPRNPVFIAPLAGITDKVFRKILWQMGAGFCYTEMVSAKALIYQNKKTHTIMDIQGEEDYCGIQIFGPDPNEMAEAAKMAANAGAPLVDINMGCPVPKVVNNGEGSALLKDLTRALKIAEAVVNAVDIPVTVKLRKGFHQEDTGITLAKELESVGVAAVAVHGRYRTDYYSGNADWDAIKQVKQNATIPILGNGDIFIPEKAKGMMDETHCDGVMLARGILGNPWLVRDTVSYLKGKAVAPSPTPQERVDMAMYHLEESCKLYGDWLGIRHMRKFLGWYIRGFRDAAKMRREMNKQTNVQNIEILLNEIAKANYGVNIETISIPPEV